MPGQYRLHPRSLRAPAQSGRPAGAGALGTQRHFHSARSTSALETRHQTLFVITYEAKRWQLPGAVYLEHFDTRLRLDLDTAAHRALLRAQLERARPLGELTIVEAEPESVHGWCGGRPHEIVILLGSAAVPRPAPAVRSAPIAHRADVHLPGSSRYDLPYMSARIEDYALVGDLDTAALIGRDGAVDWACFTRFDSPSAFSALLGDETHGSWQLGPAGDGHVPATPSRYRGWAFDPLTAAHSNRLRG